METFTFYEDCEVKGFVREEYEVEANSYEEALEMINKANGLEEVGEYQGSEPLDDTFIHTGRIDVVNENNDFIKTTMK